jgi:hypothetical protein
VKNTYVAGARILQARQFGVFIGVQEPYNVEYAQAQVNKERFSSHGLCRCSCAHRVEARGATEMALLMIIGP